MTTSTPMPQAHAGHGYISDKDRYLARLKRIEGQARGIHRMIDENSYCIDILTQISAVTAALENVALGLLEEHLAVLGHDVGVMRGREKASIIGGV